MEIINEELYEFVNRYLNKDTNKLLLDMHGKALPFSLSFAVTQINARRKTQSKIPSFISLKDFVFPDSISAEQATDERVARFHAGLAGIGKKILDLTGGLGIDSFTLARYGNKLTVCEINPTKAQMLKHNSMVMELSDFTVCNKDCRDYMADANDKYDIIYIDPARRDSSNNRTYSLKDCEPDVIQMLPDIMRLTSNIMIKVSPVLDIDKLINDVPHLEMIYAVCVKGECKELLLHVRPGTEFKGYRIVDLDDKGIISDIKFSPDELKVRAIKIIDRTSEDSLIFKYLYEPNAGVMKLPRKSILVNRYKDMEQISINTPLFISDHYHPDFPGRVLQINGVLSKSEFKNLQGKKYNVVCRNYPLGADELRKKLKVKEGQDDFIYAFRYGKQAKPVVCIATRK